MKTLIPVSNQEVDNGQRILHNVGQVRLMNLIEYHRVISSSAGGIHS